MKSRPDPGGDQPHHADAAHEGRKMGFYAKGFTLFREALFNVTNFALVLSLASETAPAYSIPELGATAVFGGRRMHNEKVGCALEVYAAPTSAGHLCGNDPK